MTQAFNLAQFANNLNASGQAAAGTSLTGSVSVANGGTGLATITANNVILGNGTTAVQVVAPGTSGNVLQSNGTTWISSTIVTPYIGMRGQYFTTSGTFTVPTGVTAARVSVIGGGGGGSVNSCCTVNGGAEGGAAVRFVTGLTSGGSVTVTVGAGGGVQAAGGTTSFGVFVSATGGAGGFVNAGPPSKGSGSGGTWNSTGLGAVPEFNGRGVGGNVNQSGTGGSVIVQW